jgi:hypothetical protein
MQYRRFVVPLVFCVLVGCGESNDEGVVEPPLVRAGTAYITQSDLDYHLTKFDESARSAINNDPASYRRLLESIAVSEVMAQRGINDLTETEMIELDAAVRDYRRQRLAAGYAAAQMAGQTITMADLQSYYQTHPEYSAEEGNTRPFYEVLPILRRELSVIMLREQLAKDRKQFNKEIEFFE